MPPMSLHGGFIIEALIEKNAAKIKPRSVKKTCQWQIFSVGHACFTGMVRWFPLNNERTYPISK